MPQNNLKSKWDTDFGFALGRQMTIEYYECRPEILLDEHKVEQAMLKAAKKSGATIISSSFHKFKPQGVSGVIVIAESHFTVHAWPEHDYAAVDIFTCADSIDLETAVNVMKEEFGSNHVMISSDQNRGVISKPVEQKRPETRDISRIIDNPDILPISWKEAYNRKQPWGVLTSVDIYQSDSDLIRDATKIEQFVYQLCDLIEMKRFGECQVVHFGEDEKVEGFSMTQLIETSLISGHFANASNAVYLDVFSCKFYEPREVAEFTCNYFKGENYKMQVAFRQ